MATAPHEIALTFTEGVEPLFSTVEVRDGQGSPVATSKPRRIWGQSQACGRTAGSAERDLHRDLACHLSRYAQDRGAFPVHRCSLNGGRVTASAIIMMLCAAFMSPRCCVVRHTDIRCGHGRRSAGCARLRGILHRLIRVSAACALLAGVAWLAMESAVDCGCRQRLHHDASPAGRRVGTQYGQWFVLRCVLLIVLLVMPLSRRVGFVAAIVLAGIALAVQPLLGHAGAMGGNVGRELIASEIVHLAAAGAWLGGLLPLFIAVGFLPHEDAARMCRNFTPIGLSAVLLLAGTAVVQVATLMGGLPGLFGTAYGHVALVKLGLFCPVVDTRRDQPPRAHRAYGAMAVRDRICESRSPAKWHSGALVVIVAAFLLVTHTRDTRAAGVAVRLAAEPVRVR